jgi:hypothetical protein
MAGRHASLAIKEFGQFKVTSAFERAPVIDSLRFERRRFRENTICLLQRSSVFITRRSYRMFDTD